MAPDGIQAGRVTVEVVEGELALSTVEVRPAPGEPLRRIDLPAGRSIRAGEPLRVSL